MHFIETALTVFNTQMNTPTLFGWFHLLWLAIAASVMNEIAYRVGLLKTETFNMFFISPYCDPSLPVYSLLQQVVPFPGCLIIYILGFTAAAYVLLLVPMCCLRKKKTQTSRSKLTTTAHFAIIP